MKQGFVKVGVQMGLGLTFSMLGSTVWGSVKAEARNDTLKVLVSTENRRVASIVTVLVVFLMLPFFFHCLE